MFALSGPKPNQQNQPSDTILVDKNFSGAKVRFVLITTWRQPRSCPFRARTVAWITSPNASPIWIDQHMSRPSKAHSHCITISVVRGKLPSRWQSYQIILASCGRCVVRISIVKGRIWIPIAAVVDTVCDAQPSLGCASEVRRSTGGPSPKQHKAQSPGSHPTVGTLGQLDPKMLVETSRNTWSCEAWKSWECVWWLVCLLSTRHSEKNVIFTTSVLVVS